MISGPCPLLSWRQPNCPNRAVSESAGPGPDDLQLLINCRSKIIKLVSIAAANSVPSLAGYSSHSVGDHTVLNRGEAALLLVDKVLPPLTPLPLTY